MKPVLMLSVAATALGRGEAPDSTRACDCHSTCTGSTLMFDCGKDEVDRWLNPCIDASFSEMPFCDESLPVADRVSDLIKRIPDDEKLGSAGKGLIFGHK